MFGPTRAPEIDQPGLTWFNVPAPPRLADLTGGMVNDFDDGRFTCTGTVCLRPGEPPGVWAEGAATTDSGRILLAGTNNHRILCDDLASREYHTWTG